ncbi:hypothetical protein BaRGS_00008653 [Batillaria attramentaria]|uniref:Endonuclease/exonuclease/phosphatase domain-containing protein n=1 Tax=Batillaria attramentaria TaxID=370345 RepID=A0ABD0LLJ0_9CAEN
MMLPLVLVLLASGHVTFASLTIGSFNIQRLSDGKVSDHAVLSRIVQILLRFDIAVIEEALHTDAVHVVLTELNKHGHPYSLSISPAMGRSSYKEHLAVLYRSDLVSVRGTDLYPDSGDHFEREPYTVLFHTTHASVTTFAVMGVHLRPDGVVDEMNRLVDAADHAMSTLHTHNLMITGDFNADCRYLSNTAYEHSALKTDGSLKAACHGAMVYNFETAMHLTNEQALAVSDHYPIQVQVV